MPKMVDELTETEEKIEAELRKKFTEEQMCAYFLTKTIRSQYQFDDEFVAHWYEELFDKKPEHIETVRRELVQSYTHMLMVENKYKFHLDYWLRQYQEKLITQMESFFGGEPGK
ncbi:hypothetical protein [Thiomicrorhabdus arctica]|uniref:hypothetical protein n=1 Tax=Thiomicrorhabdus arctica TaxID=131540 RepID=UPI0003795E24|nr:hypothetical protein [Thiomicrorhabdus arctica]